MALRFTVQGDTEAETAAGLRQLLTLGLRDDGRGFSVDR